MQSKLYVERTGRWRSASSRVDTGPPFTTTLGDALNTIVGFLLRSLKIGTRLLLGGVFLVVLLERTLTLRTGERVERLQAELSSALRPGLDAQSIDAELNRLQFRHVRDSSGRVIQARRTGIGLYLLLYDTELLVKIDLNANGQLLRQETTVFHWGL